MTNRKSLYNFTLLLLTGFVCTASYANDAVFTSTQQLIYPKGSQQSFKGTESYFTGDIRVDMVFPDNKTAQYSAAYVTFQPGARTAWHNHPAGQHMIITSGTALTGTRDGKITVAHQGDAVWCPPNIDHWHGATSDEAMTHMVITGHLDGNNVIWKDKVSDSDYNSTP